MKEIHKNGDLPCRGLNRSLPNEADLEIQSVWREAQNGREANSLERDTVLVYGFEARLPDQGHVASIGRLKPPGEESGHRIPAN